MVVKEFKYRGKTMQELEQLSIEEFAKLLNARAKRSVLRGFDKKLLKKIEKERERQKKGETPKAIRTHRRDIVIIPAMVGLLFGVHKGNSFEVIEIKPQMLGHYLGEMVLTRKRLVHGKAGIGATRSSTAITARG